MKILRSWSSGLRIILEKIGKQIRKQKYKRHYKLLFNEFQKKIFIYIHIQNQRIVRFIQHVQACQCVL